MKYPISPFIFKQELYKDDPWKMLVICMMLNQTSYKQVDNVKDIFFDKFASPQIFINSSDEEIINIIKPLGFYNRRCKLLKKFTLAWLNNNWKDIKELPGIGKYASDAYTIFIKENINVQVEDKELKKYIEWAKTL